MTSKIDSVEWQSAGGNTDGWSATETLDFTTETAYEINFANNVSDQARAPNPKWIYVDNLASNVACRISYGSYAFSVIAFSQNKFLIPSGVRKLTVSGTAGIVTVYLTELDTAPNPQYDQRAAIADANPVDYSYVTYSATRAQLATDSGKSVLFQPTAGDMDYTLLDASLGGVKDGFVSFFKNLGTKNVSIKPIGGLSINGFWTNANPIILKPGQAGTLSSNGSSWYYTGEVITEITVKAAPYNNAALITVAHGLPRKPKQTELYAECVTAENGYSVGDRLNMYTIGAFVGGGSPFYPAFVIDATNIYFNFFNAYSILVMHKTSAGTAVNLTGANWKVIAVCLLDA